MADNGQYFDLMASQRYYYLVCFKLEKSRYTLRDFWKDCKSIKKSGPTDVHNQLDYVIEHSRIRSKIKFYGGDDDYSINGDGKAPYQYDVFGIENRKENIMIFGFPFKNLAKSLLESLIGDHHILSKGSFQKARLKKMLKQIDADSFENKYLAPHFSNLDLIYTAEKDISAVQLDGDNPLKSSLFKEVFERKIDNDQCLLSRCSLRCKTISHDSEVPNTFSNIHLDSFGNFKIYLHASGKNILTVPLLFELLLKNKCLEQQLSNPILKLRDDEQV